MDPSKVIRMKTLDKRKLCPGGAYTSYPIGTITKIKMGDQNCKNCPLYQINDGEEQCNYKGT